MLRIQVGDLWIFSTLLPLLNLHRLNLQIVILGSLLILTFLGIRHNTLLFSFNSFTLYPHLRDFTWKIDIHKKLHWDPFICLRRMKSQGYDDWIWVSTSRVAEYFESDCWKPIANPFIQKRTCALHVGCMFHFYHQLHWKYNWRDVELNIFKPNFCNKFHVKIWELFFPHKKWSRTCVPCIS